jgi:hypothetical protein
MGETGHFIERGGCVKVFSPAVFKVEKSPFCERFCCYVVFEISHLKILLKLFLIKEPST